MTQDDLRFLAARCNARFTDLFCFDLTQDLRFVLSDHFWELHGRGMRCGIVRQIWLNAPPNDRPDYREVLARCQGIESTDDPAVALARILDLEHRIASKENPTMQFERFPSIRQSDYEASLRATPVVTSGETRSTLTQIVEAAHANSVTKGFWDDQKLAINSTRLDQGLVQRTIPEKLALIHSEVSEALEDYRDGAMVTTVDGNGKPVGFPSELADIVIRVCDLAGALGIDLDAEIAQKMRHNAGRSRKHGKVC
jgi:NTP pyrophosphatase (non-canonical NTP hydrolase)